MCIKELRLVTMQLPENSRPSDQDAAELRHNEVLGSSLPNRENVAGKNCVQRDTHALKIHR